MVFNIDQFVKVSDFNFGIQANSLIIMSNFIVMYTVMHQKHIKKNKKSSDNLSKAKLSYKCQNA